MRIWEYRATEAVDGMRLSQLLHVHFQLSRKQISRLKFQKNGICVNERACKTDHIVKTGDHIVLRIGKEPTHFEKPPVVIPLRILYETVDLVAVHKPSGMAFHPGHGHYYDTLSVQLDHQLKREGRGTCLHAIGRLDKDTSGIALFAKHAICAQRLHAQLKAGSLQKTYQAIAHGQLPVIGEIHSPIRRKTGSLNQMEVHPQGKWACTYVNCLRSNAAYSLLRLHLETGRTHQIRVHLQSIAHPLAGDVIYGYADAVPRLALHAYQLQFQDPFQAKTILLRDVDDSFEALIRDLCPTAT